MYMPQGILQLLQTPRKEYKDRSAGRVTDETIELELIYLKALVERYFQSNFQPYFVEHLTQRAQYLYHKTARNVAIHAWRKSSTRKAFIVSCIYASFKLLAAIPEAVETSKNHNGTRAYCIFTLHNFLKKEEIKSKMVLQYMNIHNTHNRM